MSIDIDAVLVCGLTIKEFKENGWDEDRIRECEDDFAELGLVSPHYDMSYDDDDAIFGVVVERSRRGATTEVDATCYEFGFDVAMDAFKQCTGLDGKLYLSPDVW